jgi:hypothetical protein
MKTWILIMSLFGNSLLASDGLKKAFAEGIKASVEVVKYEKSQTLKPIPKGYCATVMGKDVPLDMWEEVKLESLALFLEFSPSLLASQKSPTTTERVLCLSISTKKEDAIKALKKIRSHYPKMNQYITKVEILSTKSMHRVIPGVGEYFEDKHDEIEALKRKIQPDSSLNGRIVFLNEKKKPETLFNNGSTRVLASALQNVLYVEHTVYRRKSE